MASEAPYNLMNRAVSTNEAIVVRARALERRGDIGLVDPVIDEQWARIQVDSRAPNSYFDYYFSGQDIRAYVAETGDDPDFGQLPIVNLGFNIEQEKMPLYGAFDYTFSTVARGNRLVTGTVSLATKYPGYMKDLLAKAAKNRSDNLNSGNLADAYPAAGGLTEDDRNIEKYWGKHIDRSAIAQGASEWSVHPPFSLVIIYGIQDTSTLPKDLSQQYDRYQGDTALFADHNQRLVEADYPGRSSRIILDNCELKSVTRQYVPDGSLLTEDYQFFARDVITPSPEYQFGLRTRKAISGGS